MVYFTAQRGSALPPLARIQSERDSFLIARAVRADRSNIGTLIHGNQRYP